MKPSLGEYRYGGDCVYVGVGTYSRVTHYYTRSKRHGAPRFPRTRMELVDVELLSRGHNFVEMGWNDAHEAAWRESENRLQGRDD